MEGDCCIKTKAKHINLKITWQLCTNIQQQCMYTALTHLATQLLISTSAVKKPHTCCCCPLFVPGTLAMTEEEAALVGY